MSTVTWYYKITKTYSRKTDAWLTGDQLSWLGPFGGKFQLVKLGNRAFQMSAIVPSEAVESGIVAQIVGSSEYGIRSYINEEKKAS